MSLSAKLRHAPLRIATGAYILNSGVGKLSADDETGKGLHGAASGAYPQLQHVDPNTFTRVLAVSEVALGSALLLPLVPARVAGAGLVGFSGALLGLYWRTPGMREPGSPRPTQQGAAIAKDTWMLGIGTSLLLDSEAGRSRAVRKAERKAANAERKAELSEQAIKRKAELAEQAIRRKAELAEAAATRKAEAKAEARARAKMARAAAKKRGKKARNLAKAKASAAQPYVRAARHAAQSAASGAGCTARSAMSAAREAANTASDTARQAASAVRS
jgi:uncharacterized membrane protein YphA (DoxX/SURF4 family)